MSKPCKIGIGTVQLGLDYGITNNQGQASLDEAGKIFKLAQSVHITTIDTASSYGQSEEVLGMSLDQNESFQIITKTPLCSDLDKENVFEHVCNTLYKSFKKMKIEKCHGLLVHHVNDLLQENSSEIIRALMHLKETNKVNKIGFSFYSPDEAYKVLSFFTPDIVQLPLSTFNQTAINSNILKTLKEKGVEIHIRSIFLQGLAFVQHEALNPYFDFAKEHIKNYQQFLAENKIGPLTAALSFALNVEEVDKVILGVCNSKQLKEIISELDRAGGLSVDWSPFHFSDERLTDPSKWKLINE